MNEPVQETQEMRVQSLGQKDPLEEAMATCSSFLAWKLPWTKEPGGSSKESDMAERMSAQTCVLPFSAESTHVCLSQQLPFSVESTHVCLSQQVCCCSITKSCLTLCDPKDCSTPDFPVLHHLLEFVHWVSVVIQPSHPLSSPSPPVFTCKVGLKCSILLGL